MTGQLLHHKHRKQREQVRSRTPLQVCSQLQHQRCFASNETMLEQYFPLDLAKLIHKTIRVQPDIMFGADINVFVLCVTGDVYRTFTNNINRVEIRYKYVNRLLDDQKDIQYQTGTIETIVLGNREQRFQDEVKVTDRGEVYLRGQKIPGVSDIVTAKVGFDLFRYFGERSDYEKRGIATIRKDGRVLVGMMLIPKDNKEEIPQFNITTIPRFNVRSDVCDRE